MATKKKLLQAAAGTAAAGAALNVEDVFSTYLYEGNGSTQTITNDIDLSGEGGLVWIKNRTGENHGLIDTEVNGLLFSNLTNAANTGITHTFNSDGFTVGSSGAMNDSPDDHASWTFRKAPKFFDVVTYTGDGVAGKTISHSLGSVPGFIIIKATDYASGWYCYHRSLGNGSYVQLDSTNDSDPYTILNNTDPTDTEFTLSGAGWNVNRSGTNYVAYLFAHNDGDGEFGPDGDADIIKCGSYTGTGTANTPEVDLGWEPQFLLIKNASNTSDWYIVDNMRGAVVGGDDAVLRPNLSNAEFNRDMIQITPTGFTAGQTSGGVTDSGDTYIYIAIRRGPMAVPEDATDVFAVDLGDNDGSSSNPEFSAPFPVDAATLMYRSGGSDPSMRSRLTGTKGLRTNLSDAEFNNIYTEWDFQDGWFTTNFGSTYVSHMWRRAPNFFDVVAYTGDGTAGRTVSHNLGVAPEMMWVKPRETGLASSDWWVFHKDLSTPADDSLVLNFTGAENTGNGALLWNSTMPTSSVFSLGSYNGINQSGRAFIAYLFASLDGVSKVGSYTGNGGSQTIDCGFSAGARFVLIKCTNITSSWLVFDTERGIVAGNDNALFINSDQAELTTNDYIDPDNSGFAFDTSNALVNGNGNTYIFYAIA